MKILDRYPPISPLIMTFSLVILAIPSCFLSWIDRPWDNIFAKFIYVSGETITLAYHFNCQEFFNMAGSSIDVALIGMRWLV